MQRNGWETAIRCLAVALHPNTGDAEVLAAINGFRRTAERVPLAALCAELAGCGGALARPGEESGALDRLGRDNLDLRLQLERARAHQDISDRRLAEAEQRLSHLDEELREAQQRAALAEQYLAELSAAHAEIAEGLRHEIGVLHTALGQARQPLTEQETSRFADIFAAAQHRAERPPGIPAPAARSPWTA